MKKIREGNLRLLSPGSQDEGGRAWKETSPCSWPFPLPHSSINIKNSPQMASQFLFSANCSGHGTSVLVNSQTLCKCDPWFTGGGDFFDARVMPPDFSLNCVNSRIGAIVIWTLALCGAFVRTLVLLRAIINRCQFFKVFSLARFTKFLSRDAGIRFLFFDFFVINVFILLTCSLKVYGQILGTDVAVTICFALFISSHQFNQLFLNQLEFRTLVSITGPQLRTKLIRWKLIIDFLGFSMINLSLIAIIWCLFLDKSLGPIANGEYIIVIFRNGFSLVWSSEEAFAFWIMIQHIKKIVEETKSDSETFRSLSAVLTSLEKENRSQFRTFLMFPILYIPFMLPWLWSQQTFVLGLMFIIFSFRHNAKKFSLQEGIKSGQILNKTGSKTTMDLNSSKEGHSKDSKEVVVASSPSSLVIDVTPTVD